MKQYNYNSKFVIYQAKKNRESFEICDEFFGLKNDTSFKYHPLYRLYELGSSDGEPF